MENCQKINNGFTVLLQIMLNVKFLIIKFLANCNLLNKRSELVIKCRHQNNLLLCNLKRNDSID